MSDILKTVTLIPGECIVLPADAEIISILVNGTSSVTADCDLPPIGSYQCYRFMWEYGVNDQVDNGFVSIIVNGYEYHMPIAYFTNSLSYNGLKSWIQDPASETAGVVIWGCEAQEGGPNYYSRAIKIQIPDNLGVPILKVINNTGGFSNENAYYYLYGVVNNDCGTCP